MARGGGPKTGSSIADTASVVRIGVDGNAAQRYWNGVIDQVSTYNGVLSSTRILALYYSRLPGAPQVYVRPLSSGLANATRTPYDGTYLYATAQYDNKGNVLSVTDVGRSVNGGKNVTQYAHSTVDGGDYRTQVNRSDTKQIYTAYDFQSGVKYGTLDIDCRRSRTQYDAIGRPIKTSIYDSDANEVFHLDMETATYDSLKDVSCAGNSNSAMGQTVTLNGVTDAVGIEGSGRSFSGDAQSIKVTDSTSLNLGITWTLSAWTKLDTLTQNAEIILKISGPPNKGYLLRVFTTGQLDVEVWNNGNVNTYTSATGIIVTGQWYHIAFTFSSGTGQFYVNGVSRTTTKTGTQTQPQTTASDLWIGAVEGGTTEELDGILDDMRIFNVVRLASEITDLWNFKYKLLTRSSAAYDDVYPTSVTTYDGVSTPRELFYDMSTCIVMPCATGGNMEDLSGHGKDGLITSGGSQTTGAIGSGRTFDGAGQRIVSSGTISDAKSVTVSAWVRRNSTQTDSEGTLVKKDYAFSVLMVSSGHIRAYIYNGASWLAVDSNAVVPTTWTHVSVVYSGGVDTVASIYINGVLDKSVTLSGTIVPSTSSIFIGAQTATFLRYN